MADNSFLTAENAINSATVFRKNYTTSTPSQQAGYEASNLADEALDLTWRGAAADVAYTTLLARLDEARNVGIPAGLGHNLSPSATWRLTADTEAVRPVWIADGVDDYGLSGETLATTPDMSISFYVYLPPVGISHDGYSLPSVLRLRNAASGSRVRFSVRSVAAGSNIFRLQVFTSNFIAGSTNVTASTEMRGGWHLIRYRYRASDDRFELWVDGVMQGFATAPATVTGAEGSVFVELSRDGGFTPARWRDIEIYDSYLSDAAMADTSPPKIKDGTERGLVDSIHFTEGSGSSAVSSKGTTTITLTGGTWADMANPAPLHSTGILEAIGQWYSRQSLRIATGTSVASTSAIGAAPRDLTISFLLELPDDFPAGTDTEICAYGPSYANGEGVVRLDASGQIVITSFRGTPDTVTSSTIRGAGVVRGRLTLKSIDSTESDLSLYLGTGTTAEALVGTVQVGPYDAVAACQVLIGDVGAGSDNSHVRLGGLRVFGAIRLEADDDLLGPCNLADPDIIECLRLAGDVASDVVSARAYTTNAVTYETISNPNVTRPAPGREGLGYPFTSGREQIEAELIDFVRDADVEVSEIFLEIWDRSNADGYVELSALCCWATLRPEWNRIAGAERTWRQRPALRTAVDGIPHLDDTWEALIGRMQFRYLNIIDEQDEVYRRILRARRDKLVCMVLEPTRLVGSTLEPLPQHLLVDHCVIGTLSTSTHTIKEAGNDRHVELDIEVEGVRRQTT